MPAADRCFYECSVSKQKLFNRNLLIIRLKKKKNQNKNSQTRVSYDCTMKYLRNTDMYAGRGDAFSVIPLRNKELCKQTALNKTIPVNFSFSHLKVAYMPFV